MIIALSRTSSFFLRGVMLSLSLIPKWRPDKIKKIMKNKSANFNQEKKKRNGIEIYIQRKKNKVFFDFIRLNLFAVKISRLPWASPGHIRGTLNIISWL